MDLVAFLLVTVGSWQVGNRRRWGFLSLAAGSAIWVVFGATRDPVVWGLVLECSIGVVVLMRNWWRWGDTGGS